MSPLVYGLLFVVVGPLFGGLLAGVDRIVSARMQGRVGPPLLQPFYDVGKLFEKEARRINPVVEPLLLGHVGFMAAAGALALVGTDLIFIAFVFALAALCLVLAAGSVNSPYSFAGAERELIVLLASPPDQPLLPRKAPAPPSSALSGVNIQCLSPTGLPVP